VDVGCLGEPLAPRFGGRSRRRHHHELLGQAAEILVGQKDAPDLRTRQRVAGVDAVRISIGRNGVVAPAQPIFEERCDLDGEGECRRPFPGVLEQDPELRQGLLVPPGPLVHTKCSA
jgi:hypothetical protein